MLNLVALCKLSALVFNVHTFARCARGANYCHIQGELCSGPNGEPYADRGEKTSCGIFRTSLNLDIKNCQLQSVVFTTFRSPWTLEETRR